MSLRAVTLAAAAAAFAVLLFLLQDAWSDRAEARREAAQASVQATTAQGQAEVAWSASAAVQAAQSREFTIRVEAREAADELSQMGAGHAPVPDDVLAGWGGAVDRLRREGSAARGAPDNSGRRSAPRPVP